MENTFRENGNKCSAECEVRQYFEASSLPGPTPEQACNSSAAVLALGAKAIENCPLEQITEGL